MAQKQLRGSRDAAQIGERGLNWTPLWLILGAVALSLVLPTELVHSVDIVGYAVCHRIPERSFILGGNQLPVCARDTGMFVACLLGIAAYAILPRRRALGFPALPHVVALALFFGAWAFDGFNSYVKLLTGNGLVYEPQNWLRLTTGALMGVALASFVVPLFNQAVWRPDLALDERIIVAWKDVGLLALIALGVVLTVLWGAPILYAPLAILSALGVVTLLTVVNGLLLVIVARRSQKIERWSQLALPLVAGCALAFTEIMLIAFARAALTQALGLPF